MFLQEIIYVFIGNPSCPVDSFLKYTSKLNSEIQDLWQRPLDSFFPEQNTWFCKSPLGKNTLAKMMSRISQQGRLSQRYTNHSIRSTAITVLDEAGLYYFVAINSKFRLYLMTLVTMYIFPLGHEARHIMAISGHKKETSIRLYSSNVSEEQTRKISESLTLATDADIHQGARTPERPSTSLLDDSDLPSTPQLNQIMNTVLSPIMSHSRDIFKCNKFDGCTVNINIQH